MDTWANHSSGAGELRFLDLSREGRRLKPELMAAVESVIDSGIYLYGPQIESLERELAARTGARFAIATASGTAALEVLMRAFGIGPGAEVITTPASFYASAKAIAATGATAVFSDVDADDYNIDPDKAAAKITGRTKAILAVHLYGCPARVKKLRAIADRAGILLLEDVAQALGASVDGRAAGAWGDGAALSFYPSKNVGALGDAGAVLTSEEAVARRAESLRFLGYTGQRDHFGPEGIPGRMDEIQAALLLVKLRDADSALERRLTLAGRYDRELPPECVRPTAAAGVRDVRHLYVIRSRHRDAIAESLRAAGVPTQIHYRVPLHHQPLFTAQKASLPVAEAWSREVLSLPLYPDLRDEEQGRVIDGVRCALREAKGGRS
ncbi:MAG: DegT/DnrJ/EryC1/StrS family aminotransferase [Bryobacteraceae bacterium]